MMQSYVKFPLLAPHYFQESYSKILTSRRNK